MHHDNIFTVAQKYITWFNIAMDQLQVAENILLDNNLMTAENKNKVCILNNIHADFSY